MKTRLIVKTRFLRSPLIVLQVAEMQPYNFDPMTDAVPGGYSEFWRDATPEDIAFGIPEIPETMFDEKQRQRFERHSGMYSGV